MYCNQSIPMLATIFSCLSYQHYIQKILFENFLINNVFIVAEKVLVYKVCCMLRTKYVAQEQISEICT